MLVIRAEQMTALEKIPLQIVEDQYVRLLFQHYPLECARAGRERVRQFVRMGIGRAAAHGYLTMDTTGLYITLMMILGSDFDSDPQFGWAQSQLDDFSVPPPKRIQVLFGSTVEYLDQVAGGSGGHLVRALLRIRGYDFEAPLDSTGAGLESGLAALMQQFYPEKAAHQGADVNLALVQSAATRAAGHGIHSPNGIAVCVTLAFMLGIGFDTDPIYWWAGDSLAGGEAGGEAGAEGLDEGVRVARLLAHAREFLEAALREGGGDGQQE